MAQNFCPNQKTITVRKHVAKSFEIILIVFKIDFKILSKLNVDFMIVEPKKFLFERPIGRL